MIYKTTLRVPTTKQNKRSSKCYFSRQTSVLQQLSFSKQKEQPKDLTRSEYRKKKQVAKAPESLPHTGEQQSIWLIIIGLFMTVGAISFKNKKRQNKKDVFYDSKKRAEKVG